MHLAQAQASTKPPEQVRLQLKWLPQFQFAGYYAALWQGYYEQEGLSVTIVPGDASHNPIEEVLAGRAEFGISDADLLPRYLEGQPVVALAAIFQHSPYALMTRADTGIRTPSDLRGKTIMMAEGQGLEQFKALLSREGIPLTSVRIIPHQWDNKALIDGRADAISAYLTVEPYQLRAAGIETGIIRATDYGVDFYGDTLFTTQNQARNRQNVVEAFRRASLRGWEYAMSNPEQIIDQILQIPGVRERGVTHALLQQEAAAMRALILPGLVDIGHMNPGRWEAMAQIYRHTGAIHPRHRSLDGFLYNRSRLASLPSWLVPTIIIAAVAGICGTLAFVWSIQLRRLVQRRTGELEAQMQYGKRTGQQLYFFKWLMDQSADPYYIISPARGFRFIYANTAACEHFGRPRHDLLTLPMCELNPHLSADACQELLDTLRQRKSMLFESEHCHSDGRIIPVEVSANYLSHSGDEYIAGHFRDISTRKRNQETMHRARQEAENISRAKDHFLAMLSHELRTPLTPVLAEVSALREDPDIPPNLRDTLEMIDRNVRLEARLIDDLLDLTRVTRGKLHLSCEPLDLHLAIKRTVEICRPEIIRNNIRLRLDLRAEQYNISADMARIHQVLWNLLKNATKFTPPGGQITIITDNEPASGSENQVIRVRVVDTGIGIAKESLTKVFDAFEQADLTIGRKFGGLGLGLAISRSVVHAHGGTIAAESDGPGKGSTFCVRLRTAAPHPKTPAAPVEAPAPAAAQKARVLLVEDNPDTLRVLERLMARVGWHVRSAESVAEALAVASQETFDVLISDLGLPDGSGLDVMRNLRDRIRGVALSGYGMEEDVDRSKAAGFVAHLTKPIDFRSLQKVVQELLQEPSATR